MAVPSPDSTLSTLKQIRIKVRKLTRSLSTSQLTDSNIDDYINTFVLYDFPEHLKLFTLSKTLSFYTQPYIDTYENNTVNANDPLFNFINKYINVHPPVYISGVIADYAQSDAQFYNLYPKTIFTKKTGDQGNAVTVAYAGKLSTYPIMQNNVSFTSIGANSVGLVVSDIPQTDVATGYNTMTGDLVIPGTTASLGTINYVTGVYSFSFPSAPALNKYVYSNTVPYAVAKPSVVLYRDNKFTVRPIPDKSYRVDVDVFVRPTEFLTASPTQAPELTQWWQYIAYGASKKVFEDRMDMESISNIMPEYKAQELLVLRRTIVQNSNQRTSTIYSGGFSNSNITGENNGL